MISAAPTAQDIERALDRRKRWFSRCAFCTLGSRVDLVDHGEHDLDCTFRLTAEHAILLFTWDNIHRFWGKKAPPLPSPLHGEGEKLSQLHGYSVAGWSELSYATDAEWEEAEKLRAALLRRQPKDLKVHRKKEPSR